MHVVLASRPTTRPSRRESARPRTSRAGLARRRRCDAAFDASRGCARLATTKRTRPRPELAGRTARRADAAHAQRLARSGEGTLMTRIHGDFHLGQVLVAQRRRLHHRLRRRAGPAARRAARQDSARCATWPACCARSIMRRRRRSTAKGTRRYARASPRRARSSVPARLRDGRRACLSRRLPCAASDEPARWPDNFAQASARSLPDREGRLRDRATRPPTGPTWIADPAARPGSADRRASDDGKSEARFVTTRRPAP